ncbi:MAG: hypothetical protein JWO79_4443 [Actinomycetia bacterium]|jgi:uncharacterized protein YciI|nr:hypothetical protein [Actinomycetes bacterium]MDQ1655813.1 hypothetical protein [Cryptosporangiaceae bacterium]
MLFALLVDFPSGPPAPELLDAHRDWLAARFAEGSYLLSGSLDGVDGHPPSALALLEAPDLESAKELMSTEPLFRAGALAHRVVPFNARFRAADLDGRFGDEVTAIPVQVPR